MTQGIFGFLLLLGTGWGYCCGVAVGQVVVILGSDVSSVCQS